MGILKLIRNLNNAEGAREAIRLSYKKHYRLAQAQGLHPHPVALFGALGSRWRASGRPFNEPMLWTEVAPFGAMAPEVGREALAEYVVCLERPQDGRIGWLRDQINASLAEPYDSQEAMQARDVAATGLADSGVSVPWAPWLRDPVAKALAARAAELFERDNQTEEDAGTALPSGAHADAEQEYLAQVIGIPVQAFDPSIPLGSSLSSFSKAEVGLLRFRVANLADRVETDSSRCLVRDLSDRLLTLYNQLPGRPSRDEMSRALGRLYPEEE